MTKRLAENLALRRGCRLVDAPVSGGVSGAETGWNVGMGGWVGGRGCLLCSALLCSAFFFFFLFFLFLCYYLLFILFYTILIAPKRQVN
jgi:hypothetical protein